MRKLFGLRWFENTILALSKGSFESGCLHAPQGLFNLRHSHKRLRGIAALDAVPVGLSVDHGIAGMFNNH
tara:strand:+ start:1922 stop:2131 length:210 start_codon:yes stop_codon:yes gene_type:complete